MNSSACCGCSTRSSAWLRGDPAIVPAFAGTMRYGSVDAPSPSARCISTLSSQRPCLNPILVERADRLKAERAVQLDRGGLRRIADHRDHLAKAAGFAPGRSIRSAACGRCRAGARADGYRRCLPPCGDRRCVAGTGRHRRSPRSAADIGDEIGKAAIEQHFQPRRHFSLARRLESRTRRCRARPRGRRSR